MGKCRCTQYKSLQIVMNGDHALVHKDREKGFEKGRKEAAAQDASRSWKSQRCKSSGGIFLPKKEKISGAVRGRKDKRLQILAVRGGNLCWKTWKCSGTRFSSYDVGSVRQTLSLYRLFTWECLSWDFGARAYDESFLWMASCTSCLKTFAYDRGLFSIVLR